MVVMPLHDCSVTQRMKMQGKPLRLDQRLRICRNVFRGLADLHAAGFSHFDIKPQNILLKTQHGPAVLGDFALARETNKTLGTTQRGSPFGTVIYAPPEQMDRDAAVPPGPHSDMWAAAATCCEILSGKPPYMGLTQVQVITEMMVRRKAPAVPEGFPAELRALLAGCFNFDARRRPTAMQALEVMARVSEGDFSGTVGFGDPATPSSSGTVSVDAAEGDDEAQRREEERLEAQRREALRINAERIEQARREADAARRIAEQARRDAERKEAERREAVRREAERREAERREAERREAARIEAERKEAERKEAERREAERREAERKQAKREKDKRKKADRREAKRREAERQELVAADAPGGSAARPVHAVRVTQQTVHDPDTGVITTRSHRQEIKGCGDALESMSLEHSRISSSGLGLLSHGSNVLSHASNVLSQGGGLLGGGMGAGLFSGGVAHAPRAETAGGGGVRPCRYGKNCKRPVCTFGH
ncbi:unnamed protein product [Pedinophyceae sp. YPF-701]|nr:unnamed protein product [Pedinophyceae sp. YPF-701]